MNTVSRLTAAFFLLAVFYTSSLVVNVVYSATPTVIFMRSNNSFSLNPNGRLTASHKHGRPEPGRPLFATLNH